MFLQYIRDIKKNKINLNGVKEGERRKRGADGGRGWREGVEGADGKRREGESRENGRQGWPTEVKDTRPSSFACLIVAITSNRWRTLESTTREKNKNKYN